MPTPYLSLSPVGSASPWAFWALGLLNNSSFVIMVASAKSISEGGTALVFLSNSLPSLMVKLSAPYWFDRVSYDKRMMMACALMIAAFGIVASFASVDHSKRSLYMQLLGCVFVSIQCGMGEASLLALAGKFDIGREKNPCLTAFSSGTGLAGVFGFTWNFVWMDWLGLPLNFTLYLGIVLAILYYGLYYKCVRDFRPPVVVSVNLVEGVHEGEFGADSFEPCASLNNTDIDCRDIPVAEEFEDEEDEPNAATSEIMTSLQRFFAVLQLWPYMIPLFVVYAAEYSLQAGTWTAIGFPVDNETARDQFYEYSNWMYQVGVFISRSSGVLFVAPLSILWLMPALQVANVVFFWLVAKYQYQACYNNALLVPAFYVGLLGGGVYINGYMRICADLPPEKREFALSSTSIAEGLGIVCADVIGLFLQACLYQIHGIDGAIVSCPLRNP